MICYVYNNEKLFNAKQFVFIIYIMHLNHDTNLSASSNHSYETSSELYNYPVIRYGVPDSMPQSQSIVNNMMYYQGIYIV